MKIYYVSKACQAKGPAFLRLAGEDYLEEGDICIVGTEANTIAYLLTNEQRSWGQCKVIDKRTLTIDEGWSNFLLYSYDGFNGRKGDVRALEILQSILKSTVLGPLLDEIIGILKFQKDHIDAGVIQTVYLRAFETHVKSEEKVEFKKSETVEQKRYFISFLKPALIEKVRASLAVGISPKDSIASIKQAYPKEFREAFVKYIEYDPEGSIYEGLKEYFEDMAVGGQKAEMKQGSKNIYKELFSNLHVNKRRGKISPHKPILLLSVMELVENGEIVSPFIPISKELEKTFEKIWKKLVSEVEGHVCAIHTPFWHMQSESFWRLEPLPWYVKKNTSYSMRELKRNFYGAIIDKELFEMFSNRIMCEDLRKIIVSTYLQRQDLVIEKLSEVDDEIRDPEVGINDMAAEPQGEAYDIHESFRIVDYSDRSIAVYGNTLHLTSVFKDLGGYFSENLKEGSGWVFLKNLRAKVSSLLHDFPDENDLIVRNDDKMSSTTISCTARKDRKRDVLKDVNRIPEITKINSILLQIRRAFYKNEQYINALVFVLTIIEGWKYKIIEGNNIYPLTKLAKLYNDIWNENLGNNPEYTANFYQVFIDMYKVRFYTLESKKNSSQIELNSTWTQNDVHSKIAYGVIEQKVFSIFIDNDIANMLKLEVEEILHKYDENISIQNLSKDSNIGNSSNSITDKLTLSYLKNSIEELSNNKEIDQSDTSNEIRGVHIVFLNRQNLEKDFVDLINRLNPAKIHAMNLRYWCSDLIVKGCPPTGGRLHIPLKGGYWLKKGLNIHEIDQIIKKIYKLKEMEVEIRII